jgi:carbon storage regulator
VAGEKVRIGIDAPGEVPVFRKEVWLRIDAERNGGEVARGRAPTKFGEL